MELQRFRSNPSISSLLSTESDEREPVCFSAESDMESAANSLMMFANAGDGSIVSNPENVAALNNEEEPSYSFKVARRKKRARTKKLLDDHFDSCADQDLMYKCKTCTRKFSTFQALGGHRASCHNKFKYSCADGFSNMHEEIEGLHDEIISCEDDLQTFNRYSSPEDRRSLHIETSNEVWANRAKPGHECPVCYRVFSSGQALGGHKRCHSKPPAAATATVGSDNSTCLSTIEDEHRPLKASRGMLLDLNMPPAVEEEDYSIGNDGSILPGDGKFCFLTISS